jgi:hypothetical protein
MKGGGGCMHRWGSGMHSHMAPPYQPMGGHALAVVHANAMQCWLAMEHWVLVCLSCVDGLT